MSFINIKYGEVATEIVP